MNEKITICTNAKNYHGRPTKLTKAFTTQGKQSYDHAYYMDIEEVDCNSLSDLQDILTILQSHNDACIIRGAPIGGEPLVNVRRLSNVQKDGTQPTIEDKARHWICIDIDNLYLPDGLFDLGMYSIVEYATNYLPKDFHFEPCVVALSSSCFVESTNSFSAHLWYWNKTAVDCNELKRYFKDSENVDESVFKAAQPHYTADPIFNGVIDPLIGHHRVFQLFGDKPTLDIKIPEEENQQSFIDLHTVFNNMQESPEKEAVRKYLENEEKNQLSFIEWVKSDGFKNKLLNHSGSSLHHDMKGNGKGLIHLTWALRNVGLMKHEAEPLVVLCKAPTSKFDFDQCWNTHNTTATNQCGKSTLYELTGYKY